MRTLLKPLNSKTREVVSLDGMWAFAVDDGRLTDPWKRSLPKGLEVPVPASYNDIFPDTTVRDHVGDVWYQTQAWVPAGWAGQRTVLRFDCGRQTTPSKRRSFPKANISCSLCIGTGDLS